MPNLPLCQAAHLRVATDGKDGDFNGMSHSGTLVVIRNVSPAACALQPMAQMSFYDAAGARLGATGVFAGTRFLHPGPVVLPLALPAGAAATATLRWIAGPVFEKNACISTRELRVTLGSKSLRTPLIATVCGDATKGISFDQTRFALARTHPSATE